MLSPTPVPTVHVIDDDASVRAAIVALLRSEGLAVQAHADAADFLQRRPLPGPSCLVLDVRMPGADGLDVQAQLRALGEDIPIIFVTGHGTIPMTVRAMRAGAVEFLTKPFADDELLQAVRRALERDVAGWAARQDLKLLRERHALLSPRERQVFALVVAGRLNKVAAAELGVSEITVKVHRRHLMEKLQLRTVADLVRAGERLGVRAGAANDGGDNDYTKV
ncbi:response regulator transcription factor [Azohydromonas lata]|uniref:Response regulator n=1 Tax=Azohydromonas lata TaxID=45677 RepID=A0ABU5I9Z9_9BURK|nr:response regulator [Azohydromonas lata]MDZ5455927.1 response regulator [Azohydromonas lata]